MKIAVVGATGLIGHHTAKAIADRGHELVVIHRQSSNLDRLNDLSFTSAIADLNDRAALAEALEGVDAVVNCAAYYPTAPLPWREEVKKAISQMENFYSACSRHSLNKIVYLGGSVALRKHPKGMPGNEALTYQSAPFDKNAYLQVKWHLDRLAIDKAKSGLPVVVGIPSTTLGEYDYGPTTGRLVVEVANKTLPAYIEGPRNIIYGGDAGLGLLRVCEVGEPGERYLLTGTNIMMSDLVKKVAYMARVGIPRAVSLRTAKTISKVQTLRYKLFNGSPPRISETVIGVMGAGQYLDGSKAEKSLAFSAHTSLDETIERALAWFRENGYVLVS